MFKSLKAWMNLPVTIKPFVKRTGTGSKEFSASLSKLCYAEGKVQLVKSKEGKEVVSHKQLYIDGSVELSELDNVIFEGKESEIQAIAYFYRNGVADIKVVYL